MAVVVSIAFRLNVRLRGHSHGVHIDSAEFGVSIAFRLNVRLRAARLRRITWHPPARLNCLSAECSIESQSQAEDPGAGSHGGVSIAFRLNVRLRVIVPTEGSWRACWCLNCLSAECSIESVNVDAEVHAVRAHSGLNCLSAECSIESLPTVLDARSMAWRLNCLSAECSIESSIERARAAKDEIKVSIAFRLNVRLRVQAAVRIVHVHVLVSQLPFG